VAERVMEQITSTNNYPEVFCTIKARPSTEVVQRVFISDVAGDTLTRQSVEGGDSSAPETSQPSSLATRERSGHSPFGGIFSPDGASDELQFFRPVVPESRRMRPAVELIDLHRPFRELGDHLQFAPEGLHDSTQRRNLHVILIFEL
jgi:hypothetical protein